MIIRDVLLLLENRICRGMSTKELDEIAFKYITSCGASPSFLGYNGYPASICVSVNEEVVHGIPGGRIIKDGDLVSIDVGAHYNGFHGDGARTFLMGDAGEEKKRLAEVAKECFFKAIEGLKSGSRLHDIGYRVQSHAEQNGFSVVRALVGHGIGQKLHEEPSVPNYGRENTGMMLKSNMTLAIEPMINSGGFEVEFMPDGWTVVTKDRKPSAHYENTVLITDEGTEILTL